MGVYGRTTVVKLVSTIPDGEVHVNLVMDSSLMQVLENISICNRPTSRNYSGTHFHGYANLNISTPEPKQIRYARRKTWGQADVGESEA